MRSGTPPWFSFTWATGYIHAATRLLLQGGAMSGAGCVKSNKLCRSRYILPLHWLARRQVIDVRGIPFVTIRGIKFSCQTTVKCQIFVVTYSHCLTFKHVSGTCGRWQLTWTTLERDGLRKNAPYGPGRRWASKWKRSSTTRNPNFKMLWFSRG